MGEFRNKVLGLLRASQWVVRTPATGEIIAFANGRVCVLLALEAEESVGVEHSTILNAATDVTKSPEWWSVEDGAEPQFAVFLDDGVWYQMAAVCRPANWLWLVSQFSTHLPAI